ncbi:MAG: alpha/beta hydrolase domain-containing protein [Candidatus Binatia bacterium]
MLTKIVISERKLFANGHAFPVTGAYERLVGRAYGEVDPTSPLNKVIVNLDNAARNQAGRVPYWTDLTILKPLDMTRGNRKILYEAPNRGSKRILMFLNDAVGSDDPDSLQHAGNGFLLRQGYTLLWSGWQGDLIPRDAVLRMDVPLATNDGKEIIALVRTELVVTEKGVTSQPLSGDDRVTTYAAATTDKSQCSLTVRSKSYERRIPIPNSEWEFATYKKTTHGLKLNPTNRHLCLLAGFKPGDIYELTYPAKNPLVLGLGFAGVRDLLSFLHFEVRDHADVPNPIALNDERTGIERVYAWGRSQSGRFLRDLVYHGFNEDESHRRVFDAISPHAAGGGRTFLNYAFARPVTSSQQHTDQLEPELFPFAYSVLKDPQTGKKDAILKRPKTDPLIVHTQTSTEYWQKRACLVHTDGRGKDISIPDNVRIYAIASAQHNTPFGSLPTKKGSQQSSNPMPIGEVLRALMVAMDLWVTEGAPPPDNQIPRVYDGTLVCPDQASTGFPSIPGIRYPAVHNRQLFLDYGPDLTCGRISYHPPRHIKNGEYKILVPKVDADGNELAGIRLIPIRVPLATYTGWNLQCKSLAEDELCGLLGSYLPFAQTTSERVMNGDPRLSVEERYRDSLDYVRALSGEARSMVEGRLLLTEDAERLIAQAGTIELFIQTESK